MSSDEDNYPDASTAQELVEKFAEITATDEALAQCYLQDREWNLEKSINDYFKDLRKQESNNVVDRTDDDDDDITVVHDDHLEKNHSDAHEVPFGKTVPLKATPEILKFITWNVDGLDERNLTIRTKAVSDIIKKEVPDIIHLQEVTKLNLPYFTSKLKNYKIIRCEEQSEYFAITLLNTTTVNYVSHEVINFPNTVMDRNLISVEVEFNHCRIRFLNSHFESTKDFASNRKSQLKIAFNHMKNVDSEKSIILAGDLNLRDQEVSEIGGLPSKIEDIWQSCGSRLECQYTWDCTRNTNMKLESKFKPRCRFDRVYLKSSEAKSVVPFHFGLLGIERIKHACCYPSDHWGIVCGFKVSRV